ncbi:LacI family DNA-binding transcriptional regulator [Jiangella rhizosphaerae]|uniref:LacI family transcriptional regulator n=1 Tax=Jiangella rhizosphaerae TaxID=2293569 RepID=A0A418KQG0_9ACTN|nr:LacI family DNA-binding transcriptional regulator [Jiangella rhizosphaerae]RIQ22793.1 LacI family transcriptional regulator [Jiangella rhizosphaerae]
MVDVARLAGVSQKTVSNVVNDYEHVSPELRARVRRAIEELGYVPNTTARTLRTGRTGVIALAVPNLSSPYFAELARYVTEAAEKRGFTILIDQTDGLEQRERMIAGGLRQRVIDGLIFSPLSMPPADLAAAAGSTPMVLLGERELPSSVDHVIIDNVRAAREATEHLLELGRRRIAALGGPVDRPTGTGTLRMAGYRAALADAGLADHAVVVPTTRLLRQSGAEAVRHLVDAGPLPDALFCFSDLMAIGAMHALRLRGIRVPDDVAVVGFDDIEEASYSNPTLTTVRPAKDDIADLAVDLLVGRLEGLRPAEPAQLVVDHQLIRRESTGGPPPSLQAAGQ